LVDLTFSSCLFFNIASSDIQAFSPLGNSCLPGPFRLLKLLRPWFPPCRKSFLPSPHAAFPPPSGRTAGLSFSNTLPVIRSPTCSPSPLFRIRAFLLCFDALLLWAFAPYLKPCQKSVLSFFLALPSMLYKTPCSWDLFPSDWLRIEGISSFFISVSAPPIRHTLLEHFFCPSPCTGYFSGFYWFYLS